MMTTAQFSKSCSVPRDHAVGSAHTGNEQGPARNAKQMHDVVRMAYYMAFMIGTWQTNFSVKVPCAALYAAVICTNLLAWDSAAAADCPNVLPLRFEIVGKINRSELGFTQG